MDFGDILNSWEAEEKARQKAGAKKSNGSEWRNKNPNAPDKKAVPAPEKAAPKKTAAPKIDPMTYWMRQYGVVDKDAQEEQRQQREKQLDRSYLHSMPCEAQIDLHGLTSDEAVIRLQDFIAECCRRNLRKVLIIHGKGNHSEDGPVLAAVVRHFIERDYRLGESGHPDKNGGGKGATWVLIREKTKGE